jgi:hypothetical protein
MAMQSLLFLILMKFVPLTENIRDDSLIQKFNDLRSRFTNEIFNDSLIRNWGENWFLDGEKAVISQTEDGMDFWAGPDALDDASHAVLWTKDVFRGDILVEFEFTRLDDAISYVNIIYLQATGSGNEGFDEDITLWNEKRKVPAMNLYFRNMNTYHISYAAFGTQNDNPELDYVRARRYMPLFGVLRDTELEPDYAETNLFQTGVLHKIAIIKKDNEIYMLVSNGEQERLFYWHNDRLPPVLSGRIGLRHMYTRGARYSCFRVFTP